MTPPGGTSPEEIVLEHRLTTIENLITSGFTGVNGRLDVLNGQVKRNTDWRTDHTQLHAVADGVLAARTTLRRKDWAIISGLLAAAGTVSGIVFGVVALVVA